MANAIFTIEQLSQGVISESLIGFAGEATELTDATLGGDDLGPAPDLSGFSSAADFGGGIVGSPWDAWYLRIWVFPAVLRPTNPRRNTDIPFSIFNAFLAEVELEDIIATGNDGLTLDLTVGETIAALTTLGVNLQIGPSAPNSIVANYVFEFDLGDGVLTFLATVSDFVVMMPDEPVKEIWEWRSQVFQAVNGSEQRVALRASPRRGVDFKFLLDQAERLKQYRRWHRSIGNRVVMPFYWYAARVTAEAAIGATRIYFDPNQTDVREGDFIVITDPVTIEGQLAVIDTLEVDGATLESELTLALTTRCIVAPGFEMRITDRTGLKMKTVGGEIEVKAETITPRPDFARPGSVATIATFDGFDLLDVQPVAAGDKSGNAGGFTDSEEHFEINYEVFDGETGVVRINADWSHPHVYGPRLFRIDRERDQRNMDYWRDFLARRRGQQVPFLMPTWHNDIDLAAPIAAGTNVVELPDSEYASEMFPFATYQRLAFFAESGVVYKIVDTAVLNPDGTATLLLTEPFGAAAADVNISKISFLNLVRLGGDVVELNHGRRYTRLKLDIRTVDA